MLNTVSTPLNETGSSDLLPVDGNHKIIGYILDYGVRISTRAGVFSSSPRPDRLCCPASLLSSTPLELSPLITTYLTVCDQINDEVQKERKSHPLRLAPCLSSCHGAYTQGETHPCLVRPSVRRPFIVAFCSA